MTATKTNERPGTRAVHRHCGMSASKARQVLDLIRGEDVQRAAEILNGTEREAAEVIGKVLASAVANAAHNDQQNPEELYVSACYADEGCHHEALAPPGPGSGHPDPQADLPHHHHREPAAGRQARAAPHAAWRRSAPTGPAGSTPRGAGPTCPAACRAAGPPRPRPRRRRPPRRKPRMRTRTSPTRPLAEAAVADAEPEVTEADTVDGGVDEDDVVEDSTADEESADADADEKSEDE